MKLLLLAKIFTFSSKIYLKVIKCELINVKQFDVIRTCDFYQVYHLVIHGVFTTCK